MKNTITITALDEEEFTSDALGGGTFAGYLDFSAMQPGDSIMVVQYADVLEEGSPIAINSATIEYEDLQLSGEDGLIEIPITQEAAQVNRIGITMKSGTVPLIVKWRNTNAKTNT